MRLIILTLVTLLAFAANSLLNRGALQYELIGPGEFATLRVAFGALTLFILLAWRNKSLPKAKPLQFKGVVGLAAYMVGFSYAYVNLDAGLGALILFGTVQVVMFAAAAFSGERLSAYRWLGAVIALLGLVVLFLPDKEVNLPFNGVLLMLVVLITVSGVLLALVSGAMMSGLGYALWYWVLPQLDVTVGALAQLLVPVFALILGALFLQEVVSLRATVAAALIVGGVAAGSLLKR